ncbi:MAG: AsmA-like C-terminal region-containing protein [candidate division WOR-3 bacterium]
MKKIVKIVLIILVLIVVIYSIGFFIIKNFLTEERIKSLVYQNLSKAGFLVQIKTLSYDLGFFTSSVVLKESWIENELFSVKSKNVKLSFNPFKIIFKKELELKRVDISDFDILVKNQKKESEEKTDENLSEKKDGISIFSNIYFRNGNITYDTFSLKNLDGFLRFSYNKSFDFETNINFDFTYKGNNLSNNSITAKGVIDSTIEIKKITLKNQLAEIDGNLTKSDKKVYYSLSFKTLSFDKIVKMFYKDEHLNIFGNTLGIIKGEYSLGEDFTKQVDKIINELEVHFSSFGFNFKDDSISIFENSLLNKQFDKLVFFGNISFNEDTSDIDITFTPQKFFNDTIELVINLGGVNLKNTERFIREKKVKISGKAKINFKILCDKKDIKNPDTLLLKSYIKFNSPFIKLDYDTFNLVLKQIELTSDKGIVKGFSKIEDDKTNGTLSISGDYSKQIFEISTLSTLNAQKFFKNYKGDGEINGNVKFFLKEKKNSGFFSLRLKNVKIPNINDNLNLNLQEAKFKNFAENFELKDLLINGKNVSGTIKNLNINYGKSLINFSGEVNVDYLNYDSLFVPVPNGDQKSKSKPPKIDDRLKGNLKILVKKLYFKDEFLENIVLNLKVENGILTVDPVNADFLKGKIGGKFVYNSKKDGYINSNFEGKKVFIDDFMKRKKYLPFDMGAKVDVKSDLNFYQDKVKESLNGKIDITAKGGWVHFTGIIEKISSVLNLPLSDTFYFDDMYGEFEIDSQKVKFDDFEMEKNGHSILYSGTVDFNRNMSIKGRYTIDMNIADTGLLEKILEMTNYPSDKIYVDFEIRGTYSKPDIKIKYNSVGEYLKDKTNESVNKMIDNLKNMFKK